MDLEDAVRTISRLTIETKQKGGMSVEQMTSCLQHLAAIHIMLIASQEGGVSDVQFGSNN